MKKKIKKIKDSKEDVLKKELAEARYQNSKSNDEVKRLNGYINQVLDILEPNHSRHYDGMKVEEMPTEIMKLKMFKNFHEGAVHHLSNVVENQREMIRWLINPETAKNDEELKRLKDPNFNGGRRF